MSSSPPDHTNFSEKILHWHSVFGRKNLPWQQDITPYRVWLSEIMLQQTQVATVIPYFARFMDAYPSVDALAGADEDQVLHLWTGLGYYARARNLHRCAKIVWNDMEGQFPNEVESLCTLPGIGRSTAGAIRSIAFGKPATILDGNVKRVLARYQAIAGWPGQSAVLKQLWEVAESLTPQENAADYSQAMMDLGATLCTRAKPDCDNCPLNEDCKALKLGDQLSYPGKKPRKVMPVRSTILLMVSAENGDIWLERRPNSGIWGGLWCFPELAEEAQASDWCMDRWGVAPQASEHWPPFRHTFSHYHLDIQPLLLTLPTTPETVMEDQGKLWYNRRKAPKIGLAAPVANLLSKLAEASHQMEC